MHQQYFQRVKYRKSITLLGVRLLKFAAPISFSNPLKSEAYSFGEHFLSSVGKASFSFSLPSGANWLNFSDFGFSEVDTLEKIEMSLSVKGSPFPSSSLMAIRSMPAEMASAKDTYF